MKKFKLLGAVLSVLMLFVLAGCGSGNDDHDLIGSWDNGEGRIFLWVFGRADAVEFRDNGTVIITEGRDSQTVDWSAGNSGHFTAGNREFTYTIVGDTLTITDSANDSWSFDRAN